VSLVVLTAARTAVRSAVNSAAWRVVKWALLEVEHSADSTVPHSADLWDEPPVETKAACLVVTRVGQSAENLAASKAVLWAAYSAGWRAGSSVPRLAGRSEPQPAGLMAEMRADPKAALKAVKWAVLWAACWVAGWAGLKVGCLALRLAAPSVAQRAAPSAGHWAAPRAVRWAGSTVVCSVAKRACHLADLKVLQMAVLTAAWRAGSKELRRVVRWDVKKADPWVATRAVCSADLSAWKRAGRWVSCSAGRLVDSKAD